MKLFKSVLPVVLATVLAAPVSAAVVTYDASNAVTDPAAGGAGASDHSFIFNGATFTLRNGATFTYDDEANLGKLRGFAFDDSDPTNSRGLRIVLNFRKTDWTADRTPKVELPATFLSSNGIDPLRDWSAFRLIERGRRNSVMRVRGDISFGNGGGGSFDFADGDVFDVFSKPVGGQHVFQMGKGANGKNLNFGMSGWFGFTHDGETICGPGQVCDGNMDFELSGGPTVIPLPAAGLLLLGGLGLLVGLRRRR